MGCGTSTEVSQQNGEVQPEKTSPSSRRADSPLKQKDSFKHAEKLISSTEDGQGKDDKEKNDRNVDENDADDDKYRPPKGGILVMPCLPPGGVKLKNRQSMLSDEIKSLKSEADVEKIEPEIDTDNVSNVSLDLPVSHHSSSNAVNQDELATPSDDSDAEEEIPNEILIKENDNRTFIESYTGLKTVVLDTRPKKPVKLTAPRVPDDALWDDPDFTKSVALEGLDVTLDWKRPQEIVENPVLFSEGTTRFDIGQGAAGTCWYLSVLAAIADMPDLISQIIPDNAYDSSKGVFHCKFWRFGEWVDVYVDDQLPVQPDDGALWGAKSATDDDEFWPSLMEKAFAKFHGSYKKASGGDASLGYINLTGGIAESLELTEIPKRHALFNRVQNALSSGSVIACTVPEEHWGTSGLVGKHAYSLTAAAKVPYKGKKLPLFRIRNPWGKDKGEWTGPWGDGTDEWLSVPQWIRDRLQVVKLADGEFWMSVKDFFTHFNKIHICNLLPDLDQDGIDDGLKYSSNIFGQWKGKTAGGCKANRMNNPKFLVSIPNTDVKINGKVPIVVQFFQHREHRRDDNLFYIRADLFGVESQSGNSICLRDLTNYKNYYGGYEKTYRYLLDPGSYLVMPTTMEEKQEKQFLIRIFSSSIIPVLPLPFDNVQMFVNKSLTSFKKELKLIKLENTQHFFGRWKPGVNSGGQTSFRSHGTNPQYLVTVPEAWASEPTALSISLMQQNVGEKHPVGFKVYKLSDEDAVPLTTSQIHRMQDRIAATTRGKPMVFIVAYEASDCFVLPAGRYAVVCFLNEPTMEKSYVLSIASENKLEISGFQTGV